MFVSRHRLRKAQQDAASWQAACDGWAQMCESLRVELAGERRRVQKLQDKLNVISAEHDGERIGRIS